MTQTHLCKYVCICIHTSSWDMFVARNKTWCRVGCCARIEELGAKGGVCSRFRRDCYKAWILCS